MACVESTDSTIVHVRMFVMQFVVIRTLDSGIICDNAVVHNISLNGGIRLYDGASVNIVHPMRSVCVTRNLWKQQVVQTIQILMTAVQLVVLKVIRPRWSKRR